MCQSVLGVDPLAQKRLRHSARRRATLRIDAGGALETLLGFFEASRIHEDVSEVFQGEANVDFHSAHVIDGRA